MLDYRTSITKEEIAAYPIYTYDGVVEIIESKAQVAEVVSYLSDFKILGFDTETRPSFRKGEIHFVSLVQVACDERVVLFRLNKCGFPPELISLLSNPDIIKVGVGVRDDLRMMQQLKNFEPRGFEDMQVVAEEYGIADKSFAKLMAIIFGVHISKRQQTSNWETDRLTEQQIRYAATDAWGALKMYQKLKGY